MAVMMISQDLTDALDYGFWQGPVYPNASTDHKNEPQVLCGTGCLFNIQYVNPRTVSWLYLDPAAPCSRDAAVTAHCRVDDAGLLFSREDPSEHNDLATSMPEKFQELLARAEFVSILHACC